MPERTLIPPLAKGRVAPPQRGRVGIVEGGAQSWPIPTLPSPLQGEGSRQDLEPSNRIEASQ